jgi:hypothetical protein
MKKLRELIKDSEGFAHFTEILITQVKENRPISENPMLDGMIIGFILSTPSSEYLFTDRDAGSLLDGTIQKLEHVATWVSNNEDELCSMLESNPVSERKTSSEWFDMIPDKYEISINTLDGWNKERLHHSMFEEKITKEEFKKRLNNSTITYNAEFLESEWIN